jgi:hypothetical protein
VHFVTLEARKTRRFSDMLELPPAVLRVRLLPLCYPRSSPDRDPAGIDMTEPRGGGGAVIVVEGELGRGMAASASRRHEVCS